MQGGGPSLAWFLTGFVAAPKRAAFLQENNGTYRPQHLVEEDLMWTKPEYVDLRVGFEVTMYFSVR